MRVFPKRIATLIGLGSLFVSSALSGPEQSAAQRRAQPGDFDFYLFTLSWSPEFCASHGSNPECQTGGKSFVIHGLWPEWNDGTWPQNCSDQPGPSDPGQLSGLIEPTLTAHEWTKHGTCSGLDADAYFSLMRSVWSSLAVPSSLSGLHQPASWSPGDIKAAFVTSNPGLAVQDMAVGCSHGELVEVEICLDKSGKPIACPTIQDCRNPSVQILPVSP